MFALWNEDYARQETVSGSWNNDTMHEGDADAVAKAVIESWEADVKSGATVKGDTIEDVIKQRSAFRYG